jgi:hypothetical protein
MQRCLPRQHLTTAFWSLVTWTIFRLVTLRSGFPIDYRLCLVRFGAVLLTSALTEKPFRQPEEIRAAGILL